MSLSMESCYLTCSISVETFSMIGFFSGAYSGAETHVPFPNTAVKGSSGDGTVNLTMGE